MIDPVALPKAELHVHIEGTFEPELIFEIAERNRVALDYPDVESLRRAYDFSDLASFLDVYYRAMAVLRHERDFYDLTAAYLRRAASQGVRHAEIFFDPQAHTSRGVAFETAIDGIWAALQDGARDPGISSHLILCFLRDLPAQSAMETLESAFRHQDRIVAVGLDSAEVGNPPSKFQAVFERARAHGMLTVAHAGEEGPPEYVWEALDLLKVSRVDHGVRSLEDPALVDRLRRQRIPLTVCPFSNVRLKVVQSLSEHPIKRMLEEGLVATCNSDDPPYFGGYVGDNFAGIAKALSLSDGDLVRLARNSFVASFIDDATRDRYLAELHQYAPAVSEMEERRDADQ
ncbi:MAG TPA: adenosine deaminase [Candidatus Acidoferrales bacterium]|nr:adenosine deaminase [Candidatus Acidoferrales bacterium]